MLKNISSFLLALVADVWYLISNGTTKKPEPIVRTPQPKKEAVVPNLSPEVLTERLKDRAFQLEMIDWVNNVLRPLEDNATYLAVAKDRSSKVRDFTTKDLKTIFAILEPFIRRGTPGHELGHHIFDALGGGAIISNDPWLATAYPNELDAAFLEAAAHDGATGIQHRYVDYKWELNHGEIFAWTLYHLLKGLVSEPVLLIACYAGAAHPHIMTKQEDGTSKSRWNDELFYNGEIPVRVAVWVTRWTDRFENGADACHLIRHAVASVDGARVNGLDLHGVDWYNFADALKFVFTPTLGVNVVIKDGKEVKIPSMLQHLRGYANSANARPCSPYNQHDDKSPNMRTLMDWKVAHSTELIDTILNTTGTPDFEIFVRLMQMKSGFPNSQMTTDTIEMVRDLWNHFSPEDQAHWTHGFEMATDHYFEWLDVLQNQIASATHPIVVAFRPLVPGLIAQVTA